VSREVEDRVRELTVAQQGLVTRLQLLQAGLTPRAIESRVKRKRLRRVQQGVYLAGPVLPSMARERAALLACGPASVLSHWSALMVWEKEVVNRRGGWPSRVWTGMGPAVRSRAAHVTMRDGKRRRRPGIIAHPCADLPSDEVTVADGLPVTTPARTLLDLARYAEARELEQMAGWAERQGLTTREELLEVVARHRGRAGARALRRLLEAPAGPAWTRSEAEERFLSLVRKVGLPGPEVNVVVAGVEVDFLWRDRGVVVEVDGFEFHSVRSRFKRDRERDADLAGEGIRVIRVTWQQIVQESEMMMVRLDRVLNRRTGGWAG
jgi:very-short-patch-repair endonuclease